MGRDIETESYRIALQVDGRPVLAHVPERLFSDHGERPSHQAAYEGIAHQRRKIETAITTLAQGKTPKAPYDTITLIPSSCP
ncbi:MAG: hypothetical protein EP318_10205 [Rhodobacteraceae bacterium]|nr:MAG: hypothetical protein EP318_10205 [Paracoccaceae bacterium]